MEMISDQVQCCYQVDTANRCVILYYPKLFYTLRGSSEQVAACAQTSPCCVKGVACKTNCDLLFFKVVWLLGEQTVHV